jgi:hypothetical protein
LFKLTQRSRTLVALAAACVFVLQTLVTAWATGALPTTPRLDAFGNPLCITSGDHASTNPASDHSKLLNCCAFGCSTVSLALAAPSGGSAGILRPLVRSRVLSILHGTVHSKVPDYNPGSPRAPPLTA